MFYFLFFIGLFYPFNYYLIVIQSVICFLPLIFQYKKIKIGPIWLKFLFVMLISLFLSILINEDNTILTGIKFITYYSLAIVIVNFKLNKNIFLLLFLITATYLGINLMSGASSNEIFFGASRNAISGLMILLSSFLYISYVQEETDFPLYPAFITLILSFIGVGRSGIISSSIFFVGVLGLFIVNKKLDVRKVVAIMITVIIAVILLMYFYDVIFQNAIYKFSVDSYNDTNRSEILYNYFSEATKEIKYLLFGVPKWKIAMVVYLNGNFHNSYLNLHNIFGLTGVITIVTLVFKALRRYKREKNYIYILLIITVLLRISTDSLSFVSYYDPLLYYLLLNNSTFPTKKGDLKLEKSI